MRRGRHHGDTDLLFERHDQIECLQASARHDERVGLVRRRVGFGSQLVQHVLAHARFGHTLVAQSFRRRHGEAVLFEKQLQPAGDDVGVGGGHGHPLGVRRLQAVDQPIALRRSGKAGRLLHLVHELLVEGRPLVERQRRAEDGDRLRALLRQRFRGRQDSRHCLLVAGHRHAAGQPDAATEERDAVGVQPLCVIRNRIVERRKDQPHRRIGGEQ